MSGPRHTGSDEEVPDHRPVYACAPNRSSEVPGGIYGDTTSQCPVYEMPPADTSVRSSIYVAEPPDKTPAGRDETAEVINKKTTCQEASAKSEEATPPDETSTVTPSSEGGTDEFSSPMYGAAPGANAEPQDKAPTDEAGGEAIAADDTELPMYEDMSGRTEEAEPRRQSTVDADTLNGAAVSGPKIELKVFLKVLKPVGAVVITVMAVVMIYFSDTFHRLGASDRSSASRRKSATYIGYILRREAELQSEALRKVSDRHGNVSKGNNLGCVKENSCILYFTNLKNLFAEALFTLQITSSQGYKDMKSWQQTVGERFADLEDLVSRAFANKPQKRAAFSLTTGPANISSGPGFQNATFTTLGATGRAGPTILGAHYRGQDHEKLVTLQDGIQLFTVPETGDYRVEVAEKIHDPLSFSAAAGKVFTISGFINGRGALMAGTFSLSKGPLTSTFAGGSFGHGATEGKTYTYKRKGSKKKSKPSVKVVGGGGGGLLTNGGGGNWVRCYGEPVGKCDGEGGRAFVNGGFLFFLFGKCDGEGGRAFVNRG
ncbi:hypothetical protein Bbelb_095370 [Branchiostoma belcheri]|nr:hypothetical protein Bbelb_095370 [Branchiostoma belcheri]